jgi:hypothetical protein
MKGNVEKIFLYYTTTITRRSFVKKILFTMACGAMLVSCASKAGVVGPAITEAKTLQALAKVNNLTVPAADSLITAAEKQNSEGQTTQAFYLADEAILKLRLSMLQLEQSALIAENKKAEDNLEAAKGNLRVYSDALNAPKEEVIQHK